MELQTITEVYSKDAEIRKLKKEMKALMRKEAFTQLNNVEIEPAEKKSTSQEFNTRKLQTKMYLESKKMEEIKSFKSHKTQLLSPLTSPEPEELVEYSGRETIYNSQNGI